MILGITPTIPIPKPIGARIICVPITTTLTIEERAKRAGLHAVVIDKERPRQSFGIIVEISIDPIIEENFKVGMGIWFGPLSGQELPFEGKVFRSLEFQEIISSTPEEKVPEPYKVQVRHFLLSPSPVEDL